MSDSPAVAAVTVRPGAGVRVRAQTLVEREPGGSHVHRRLVRLYETTPAAHQGFLILSQIRLLLRRLHKGQLFDTR